VKRISGDGSLGSPHARVAHCQTPHHKKGHLFQVAFFYVYCLGIFRGYSEGGARGMIDYH
jgi:hypothetical protein